MERKNQNIQWMAAAVGLLVLIFDSERALEGARSGVDLCIRTVIPSLFPFFVLSLILTDSIPVSTAASVRKFCEGTGLPAAVASLLVPSFLGGYPVGAKCIGDLYRKQQISKPAAQQLLTFCSNAGPSFLFGMVSGFFPEQKMVWELWLIHILSALLTGLSFPGQKEEQLFCTAEKQSSQNAAVFSAAKAMALVCCWVILFRTMIAFLKAWFLWLLPEWAQVFLTGILELTNGCCELLLIEDLKLRFVLCSCMLAFGGICVVFQTASVINGLSLVCYLKGKFLQTVYSFLLSCTLILEHRLFPGAMIPVFVMILRKTQNRYGNPGAFPV